MTVVLRSYWGKLFKFDTPFGLALILLFGIPRFIIVLKANQGGNYSFVAPVFLCMWMAPFIFLTQEGRRVIGMKKPVSHLWLLLSFLGGAAVCTIMFWIGQWCYGTTSHNWFVYISKSYPTAGSAEKQIYFWVYALVGMTFSPIGEELLYRGMIHGSFATKLGERKASLIDSLAFSITHLAHFGIVYVSCVWTFFFFPGLLWVLFMFGVSIFFSICKEKTGSILGAILCHAGFNLTMTYFIFYHIF